MEIQIPRYLCLANFFILQVEPLPLKEINFDKPRRVASEKRKVPIFKTTKPTKLKSDDPSDLLQSLRQSSPNAVIFTITDPQRRPLQEPKLPISLTKLFQETNCKLTSTELKEKCKETFQSLSVTQEQCQALEKATQKQSKSGLWHQYRAGRLTTSLFHDIVHTNLSDPAKSLLKKIMSYGSHFSSAATQWGLANEKDAISEYVKQMSMDHTNLTVRDSGFVINTKFPHLGSSPDSIVACDCCGKGTLEVKCPYKFRDSNPCDLDDTSFCLTKHEKGGITCKTALWKNHKYFSQVQGQMGICEYKYCDFICYTNVGLHIERVSFDEVYFSELEEKLTTFYKKWIMPEILTQNLKRAESQLKQSQTVCICGGDEGHGSMITCDSEYCCVKTYRMKCVGLKVAPKAKWYCLTCRNPKKVKRN